ELKWWLTSPARVLRIDALLRDLKMDWRARVKPYEPAENTTGPDTPQQVPAPPVNTAAYSTARVSFETPTGAHAPSIRSARTIDGKSAGEDVANFAGLLSPTSIPVHHRPQLTIKTKTDPMPGLTTPSRSAIESSHGFELF